MASTRAKVEAKIAGKKVMVFSKTHCPFCTMGKKALEKYLDKELSADDYEVWEIENEANCGEIQAVLRDMTGAQTEELEKSSSPYPEGLDFRFLEFLSTANVLEADLKPKHWTKVGS